MVLDIVFSLDSVITAVGMAQQLWVMVVAMIIAVVVMLIFADGISEFINRHPSMKILALSFLLLIGVLLVAEGFGKHIEKGYIYFAMAFSLLIELLNMRFRKKQAPVHLHHQFERKPEPSLCRKAGSRATRARYRQLLERHLHHHRTSSPVPCTRAWQDRRSLVMK